jgi:PAS domain-containing protein
VGERTVELTRVSETLRRQIVEWQQAEEELRTLSRAVEHSPSSVVITDPQGAIKYVNPRFTEFTGYCPEEALGQTPRKLTNGQMTPAALHLSAKNGFGTLIRDQARLL